MWKECFHFDFPKKLVSSKYSTVPVVILLDAEGVYYKTSGQNSFKTDNENA
jgi:hypothetical protein